MPELEFKTFCELVKSRNEAAAFELLESEPAVTAMADQYRDTALHWAARCGCCARMIDTLLQGGADIEAVNNEGCTPLILAASQGHRDVVVTLLNAGAHIDVSNQYGNTAMIYAAARGYREVVDALQFGYAVQGVPLGASEDEVLRKSKFKRMTLDQALARLSEQYRKLWTQNATGRIEAKAMKQELERTRQALAVSREQLYRAIRKSRLVEAENEELRARLAAAADKGASACE